MVWIGGSPLRRRQYELLPLPLTQPRLLLPLLLVLLSLLLVSHPFCLIDAGFHKLTPEEMKALGKKCRQEHISVTGGDVVCFVGGTMVHASPPVSSGMATRYMTYAHWALSAAGSDATSTAARR